MEFVSASSTLAQLFMERSFLLLLAPKNYHSFTSKITSHKILPSVSTVLRRTRCIFFFYECMRNLIRFSLFLFLFFFGVGLGRGMQINNIIFNVSAEW